MQGMRFEYTSQRPYLAKKMPPWRAASSSPLPDYYSYFTLGQNVRRKTNFILKILAKVYPTVHKPRFE